MIRLAALLILFWPASALALEVAGNLFVENGQAVVLRGIAMGDVTDLPADANPYPEIASDWRANVVRLSIHPGTWRDKKDAALAALAKHVADARAAGLYVIIDYHVIGFPDGYSLKYFDVTEPDTRTDDYESRFDLAMDFWLTIAAQFKDPAILFELWNEPFSGSEEEEGGDPEFWKQYRPYWRVLTDAIRSSGAANVILVPPPLWAFNARGLKDSLLPDANTGYTWHAYAGQPPEDWAPALDGLDGARPVVVTEWGFEPGAKQHWSGTAEEYGVPFTAFLDERGLSSTAWCWNPDYGPNLRRPNGKLTEWGAFAKAYLAGHAP
ncbi:MAG: cellulase family glycosylhydrolase [Rhodospirillaceae bacterium]|nr:cellulase family glycosylhydrolase [Rhodospirillaceae bacterium]